MHKCISTDPRVASVMLRCKCRGLSTISGHSVPRNATRTTFFSPPYADHARSRSHGTFRQCLLEEAAALPNAAATSLGSLIGSCLLGGSLAISVISPLSTDRRATEKLTIRGTSKQPDILWTHRVSKNSDNFTQFSFYLVNIHICSSSDH